MFTKLPDLSKKVLWLIIVLMSIAGIVALLLVALGFDGPLNIGICTIPIFYVATPTPAAKIDLLLL